MHFDWNGVFPAVTTKFTKEDQLDAGFSGIFLGGTLREASTLTNVEKKILVELVYDATHAINRWVRSISFQSWLNRLLIPELRNENPLEINSEINGISSKNSI